MGGNTGPNLDFNFATGQFFGPSSITTVRASTNATDLFPTSASGASFLTFGANTPRISPSAGGLIIEEARTQLLAAPTVPATQTTGSLGTGIYTLWVNGSGSATPSAGTATITGAGAATNGTPNVFTVTVAGTVVVTVAGSLNAFQLELGTWGTTLITTQAIRNLDKVSAPLPGIGSTITLFAQATPLAPVAFATSQFVAQTNDGGTNRTAISRQATTGFAAQSTVGGTEVLGNGTTVWAQGASGKIALAFGGSSAIAFNGALQAASIQSGEVLPPNQNTLWFGQQFNQLSFLNGVLRRVSIFNTNLFNGVISLTR